jgi:hypothetical protein
LVTVYKKQSAANKTKKHDMWLEHNPFKFTVMYKTSLCYPCALKNIKKQKSKTKTVKVIRRKLKYYTRIQMVSKNCAENCWLTKELVLVDGWIDGGE